MPRYAVPFSLALTFAWLTHWEVFEYDVFWLVRAGNEILRTGHIQNTDSWSFTVFGQPWYHFQWLSSVVMALFYRIAGSDFGALAWLRSALVFFWVFGVLTLATFRLRKPWVTTAQTLLLLAPWIYLMSWLRLQMRPDLFASIFFVGLLFLLVSNLSEFAKRAGGLAILLLWVNFHSGIAPIGIFVFCAYLVLGPARFDPLRDWKWLLGACLVWFVNPQSYHVIDVLFANYSTVGNPDLQPWNFSLLTYGEGGWAYMLWAAYLGVAIYSWFKSDREDLPLPYRNPAFVAVVALALTALTFQRIRVIHYQVVFLAPIVAAGLARIQTRRWFIVGAATMAIWLICVPDQKLNISPPLGAQVSSAWNPVAAVEFIRKTHPARNLINHYNFGGYLIAALPEYPVAIDGRELPFIDFERDLRIAKREPAGYAEFLRRYSVNAAIEAIPRDGTRVLHEFYPSSDWAEVYSDGLAVVFYRRIADNAVSIQQYEKRGGTGSFQTTIDGAHIKSFAPIGSDMRKSIKEVLKDVARRQKEAITQTK